MAATPSSTPPARRVSQEIVRSSPPDPSYRHPAPGSAARAVVVGFIARRPPVADLFDEHRISWSPPTSRHRQRRRGAPRRPAGLFRRRHNIFLMLRRHRRRRAVVVTVDSPTAVDFHRRRRCAERPCDAAGGPRPRRHYAAGSTKEDVTDAPSQRDSSGASLQLSEAALVGLGIAMGPIIASIHEARRLPP